MTADNDNFRSDLMKLRIEFEGEEEGDEPHDCESRLNFDVMEYSLRDPCAHRLWVQVVEDFVSVSSVQQSVVLCEALSSVLQVELENGTELNPGRFLSKEHRNDLIKALSITVDDDDE